MKIVVQNEDQNLINKSIRYINNQLAALNSKQDSTSDIDVAERRVYMKIRDMLEGFKNEK